MRRLVKASLRKFSVPITAFISDATIAEDSIEHATRIIGSGDGDETSGSRFAFVRMSRALTKLFEIMAQQ